MECRLLCFKWQILRVGSLTHYDKSFRQSIEFVAALLKRMVISVSLTNNMHNWFLFVLLKYNHQQFLFTVKSITYNIAIRTDQTMGKNATVTCIWKWCSWRAANTSLFTNILVYISSFNRTQAYTTKQAIQTLCTQTFAYMADQIFNHVNQTVNCIIHAYTISP